MIVRQVTILTGTAAIIANTGFGDPLKIQNIGPGVLYLGKDATVLNSTGYGVPVFPAVNCDVDLTAYDGPVFGFAFGGNCDVRIIEEISG